MLCAFARVRFKRLFDGQSDSLGCLIYPDDTCASFAGSHVNAVHLVSRGLQVRSHSMRFFKASARSVRHLFLTRVPLGTVHVTAIGTIVGGAVPGERNGLLSRSIAHRITSSRRAKAIIAIFRRALLPRLIFITHACAQALCRQTIHADSVSIDRSSAGPRRVMWPKRLI